MYSNIIIFKNLNFFITYSNKNHKWLKNDLKQQCNLMVGYFLLLKTYNNLDLV